MRWVAVCLSVCALLGACSRDSREDGAPEDCVERREIATGSGLRYTDLDCGAGNEAIDGSAVTVHYEGRLEDGTPFDSSRRRGEPFTFVLGDGRVIPGWEEGIEGMLTGGVRRLILPPELAYGDDGYPPIVPGGATVLFEIELREVELPSD
jgi:FKBP-type peptidyl-prolyl cis-trans isomerase